MTNENPKRFAKALRLHNMLTMAAISDAAECATGQTNSHKPTQVLQSSEEQ